MIQKGKNNQMHQYKMESQEGLSVIAENKVNVYHQYYCQNSKASVHQVTKINFFLGGEKKKKREERLPMSINTSVSPGWQPERTDR